MSLTLDAQKDDKPLCANAFGHFREAGREFVIGDLATPMPWTNVLSNGKYGLVISQNGGGFSWADNCQTERVTRWDQDLVLDRQGRFVYLQDLDEPEHLWSTTRQPTTAKADLETVVHGIGYSVFERLNHGISSRQTVFVPRSDPCEVWILTVRNEGQRARRLRVSSYLEWHLGMATDWHREFHRLFYESSEGEGFVSARKLPGFVNETRKLEDDQPFAFHSCSGMEETQWLTDKASFLGQPADISVPGFLYGHRPQPVNSRWNDPIAAAIGHVSLEPGEERNLVFVVGSVSDQSQIKLLIERYRIEGALRELALVKESWQELCERCLLETPDPATDLMTNYWLKYQTLGGRMLARCAYYQQGGAYGFRDQLQDSLGMLSVDAQTTRRQILLHAEATYEDGAVRHWWHPNTDIFVESRHSDTCLWVPYATLAYLDETNDLDVLNIRCRYLSHETQEFISDGSLLDHCLVGIERALHQVSPRGVPLILSGDWNDGLSHAGIDGKGESFWLGMFLYDILKRWTPVLDEIGFAGKGRELDHAADQISRAVNEYGWDGEWYLQGTRDDALPLGSKSCAEGQIFLNPQTWSVISGIASHERAEAAIESVRKRLIRPYGALLLSPAFHRVDPFVGYITRYAPGLRENGGVYSHASTWAIQALSMAGFQDEARDLFRSMLPCNGRDAKSYQAEPYVMPGNVDGPDSPFEGRAGWTWYTGSATWMYRMCLEWICGIRATREGLLVDTRSGSKGVNFRLRRPFRGDVFNFEVSGLGAVAEVTCDSAPAKDGRLQSTASGKEHVVRVRLE